jgi:hypothetical protein
MMRNIYRTLASLMVATLVLLGVSTAYGQQPARQPSGTFEFVATSFGAGIGFSSGEGIVYDMQGKPIGYFSVEGLSVGSVGMTTINAKGKVYNLKKPADFAGNYAGGGAGLTIGAGGASAELKNSKGVVITFETVSQGVKFQLAAGGLKIKLHPPGG